jgi:amino acid transporter
MIIGGSDMASSNGNEHVDIDWSSLTPSTSDKHQDYVFIAHCILAIVISVLSFTNGWISWAYGTGLITPLFLVIAGSLYDLSRGINWYRDEFIPFVSRTRMIPEFEANRFLKYKRINRLTLLLAGYLSTAITQFAWILITSLGATTDLITIVSMLVIVFILMVCVFLIVLFAFLVLFERLWNSVYSDAQHIIDLDNQLNKYYNAQKEEQTQPEVD